ncbi:MAG: sulfurtransferase TusA family protein [Fibrobacter sp.]|nr:sulfurtransferase TusA family protein [Fibrobacter sp.]
MPNTLQNSSIMRWLIQNQEQPGFVDSVHKLLSFACSEWIRRETSQILKPEEALAKVIAAKLTDFPLADWLEQPNKNFTEIVGFCEKAKTGSLPDVLKENFPSILDLRGLPCPKNAVRSRLVMTGLPLGHTLNIMLDDGSAIENVPHALVADGHFVQKREKKGNYWILTVVKGQISV